MKYKKGPIPEPRPLIEVGQRVLTTKIRAGQVGIVVQVGVPGYPYYLVLIEEGTYKDHQYYFRREELQVLDSKVSVEQARCLKSIIPEP